jgi:hypothetical protein
MLTEAEDSSTNSRLLEFRNDGHHLLRECDRGMINQPAIDILQWSRKRKRERLKNLERMHRVYVTELKREAESLHPITNYFKSKRDEE